MSGHPDLDAMARRVIDANLYMTVATLDPGGAPRLSPVYFTPARYTDLYWVSAPDAHHSRNLLERSHLPAVSEPCACGMLRASESISATVCSAAATMFDCGALATTMPRLVAAPTT